MKINILFFGQLTDIAGTDSIEAKDLKDTDELTLLLYKMFPALEQSKYVLAVDTNVVSENTLLTSDCTVALLPPFSGG